MKRLDRYVFGGFARSPFTGRWNEEAQTLTFTATEPENIRVTLMMKFLDNDHLTWHGVWTKDGEVMLEIDGKVTRRRVPDPVRPR